MNIYVFNWFTKIMFLFIIVYVIQNIGGSENSTSSFNKMLYYH